MKYFWEKGKVLRKHKNNLLSGGCYEPPLTNVFTMQWFLTLFATCLPKPTVLRVWDSILLDGSEILLRTALVIWGKLSRYFNMGNLMSLYSNKSSFCNKTGIHCGSVSVFIKVFIDWRKQRKLLCNNIFSVTFIMNNIYNKIPVAVTLYWHFIIGIILWHLHLVKLTFCGMNVVWYYQFVPWTLCDITIRCSEHCVTLPLGAMNIVWHYHNMPSILCDITILWLEHPVTAESCMWGPLMSSTLWWGTSPRKCWKATCWMQTPWSR